MKPKISVVLPIYNVKKYLETCVKAMTGQTYQNLEIILVDDGSPDGCPALCDELAKTDKRIRVLHKENGGLSDARNAGTQIATGEYITFVDSDDVVTETYVEYLYSLVEKYGCDMSLCTHTVVFEDGKKIPYGDGTDEMLDAKECLRRMLYHDVIDTSAWAKLYRTEGKIIRRYRNNLPVFPCKRQDRLRISEPVFLYAASEFHCQWQI